MTNNTLVRDLTNKLTGDLDLALARTVLLADDSLDQLKIVAGLHEYTFRVLCEMTYALSMNTFSHRIPLEMKEKFINDTVDKLGPTIKRRLYETEKAILADPVAVNQLSALARLLRRS